MTEKIDFTVDYGAKENSSIIKVIGVGGGGSNAVKHMYSEGIIGVDFLVCNTDKGHLSKMPIPNKLILGDTGLGAGANPEVARKLALDSKEKIREFIGTETRMLFITAGMGKGTGTGASPVIAEIAKSMNILTIGVVTYPFHFEGSIREQYADAGIAELAKNVDSLIVVKNQNIMKFYNDENVDTGFGYADDVLKNAVKCIAELITVNYEHNIDFNDIQTIMKNSGKAMLGIAIANGENRVDKVVDDALACPLLDNTLCSDAKNFLFFVSYGDKAKLKFSELDALTEKFEAIQSKNAQVIWGRGLDKTLGDSIKLSVIVTNFSEVKKENTIIPAENTNDEKTSTPKEHIIVTDTKITENVIDNGHNLFQNKVITTPENDNMDDFGSLTGESASNRHNYTPVGNTFTFEGNNLVPQNDFTPRPVEDKTTDNIPTETPSKFPQNMDNTPGTPKQIRDSHALSDEEFSHLVDYPSFTREQMSKASKPAAAVATAHATSMYEVDDDAHEFFKNLPD